MNRRALFVVLGVALAAGLLVWGWGKIPPLKKKYARPVAAVAWSGPPFIPRQVEFPAPGAPEADGGDPPEASRQWQRALAAAEAGEGLSRAIGERWPDSDAAVAAQLALLGSDDDALTNAAGIALAEDFVARAGRYPRRYFSEQWQAASQRVAAALVRRRLAEGKAAEGWRICVRWRWAAPRVELLAPACRELTARVPEARLAPEATLALLPESPAGFRPEPGSLSRPALDSLAAYVSDPYDAERLARALVALWEGEQREAATALRPELLELDPETLWRLETDARRFGAAKAGLRLNLVPWRL